eukprot:TRINITY_DN32006_c0_g1_i1.p1 TRINITY_DN32006_c0_g1~~TRINITY_DN32006_c0_g1_i1.p1  ORF type:complete len:430 (-),score=53.23 TRINITY_DN32006_c0_g1_i1:1372-2625(-)
MMVEHSAALSLLLNLGSSPKSQDVQRVLKSTLEAGLSEHSEFATAILRGLTKERRSQAALQVCICMRHLEVRLSNAHFNTVLSEASRCGQTQLVFKTLCIMEQSRISPDRVSYNFAITASDKAGDWQRGLAAFSSLAQRLIAPDNISYSGAVSSCAKAANWQLALSLLDQMDEERDVAEKASYTAAMNACGRGLEWETALRLFSQLIDRGTVLDTVCCSAAIDACEKSSCWSQAVSLLHAMAGFEFSPNEISYNAAMSACGRSGQWQHALSLLDTMSERKLTPGPMCVGTACNALRLGVGPEPAYSLLKRFLQHWSENEQAARIKIPGIHSERPNAHHSKDEARHALSFLKCAPGVDAIVKPAGVSTERAVEQLKRQLRQSSRFSQHLDYFIVSRLDNPTSGVLPLARGVEGSAAAN